MIYCPYVLIKLFQQSDSEKREERERERERERGGKEVKSSAYKLDVRQKSRAGSGNGYRDKYVEKYIYKEQ